MNATNIDVITSLISAGKVLVVGLVLGAGIPIIYALGIRLLSQVGVTLGSTKHLVVISGLLFTFCALILVIGLLYLFRDNLQQLAGIDINSWFQ